MAMLRGLAKDRRSEKDGWDVAQMPPNKQLQRTVQTVSRRGARASFHYARAPRFLGQRAAAELRR